MNVFLLSLPILLISYNVQAHPVSFKGGTAVMTWNQEFLADTWVVYSFRSDAAIVGRTTRFETPEGRMIFSGAQVDYLVKRWNETDSQANFYVYGGYGALNYLHETAGASLAGIELDAETRKYYISAKYEKMWSSASPDMDKLVARIGIAPYEAEFSELASWFMIQYQRHPMLTTKEAVTPLVRLFYKSVLLETGVSTDANWMINFMFHF